MKPSTRTTQSRERRSHAERTRETRARVMDAVVESIAEVGYQKTTAAEIARRAGVTWGAAQHHFGDKDGILVAVLEESFEHFARQLGSAPQDRSLETRVARFVDRAWLHFGSDYYRSTFEILLNLPAGLDSSWQGEMLQSWNRIWTEYFPDAEVSRRHTVDLMHYTIAVLSGLAATTILEGVGSLLRSQELAFLKDTLQRELRGVPFKSRRPAS